MVYGAGKRNVASVTWPRGLYCSIEPSAHEREIADQIQGLMANELIIPSQFSVDHGGFRQHYGTTQMAAGDQSPVA